MQGTPNRFVVCYVDDGERCAFFVHAIEDALWWATFLRVRWTLSPWIERENVPAMLPQ